MSPLPSISSPIATSDPTAHPVLRWRIAILISVAIAISYLDRQTLPVAIKAIQQDIPISNQLYSLLGSAFLVAYGVMYAGAGKLLDVMGTRRGFTLVMVFWSLACASHGFAATVTMLAVSRLLLGMGEGGGFPAATRAMAEWFPVNERSSAMGIMNAGTAIGAIVAPLLIAIVLSFANWRWVFFLTGALGLVWTLWWRHEYFPPEEHPRLGDAERELLRPIMHPPGACGVAPSWSSLLHYREVWGVVTAKFLSDAAWYFYLFWLPKYLYDARGFDIKGVASVAWIPYAASGVGCLCGGWLSSWLARRQPSLNLARKIALGLSAILMPFVLLVPHVSIGWAVALFSLAYFGQQSWSTLVMSLPADLFPKSSVGAVAGLVGFGGAMGGVIFGQLAGYLLDHGFGYGPVFMLSSTFHLAGFAIICLAIPIIKPLNLNPVTVP